jgi:hypothetical protein
MDVLPRLKLLNELTAGTPPAVTFVRSFPAKGMYLHGPVQGLNLNHRPITRLETVMPVTVKWFIFYFMKYYFVEILSTLYYGVPK